MPGPASGSTGVHAPVLATMTSATSCRRASSCWAGSRCSMISGSASATRTRRGFPAMACSDPQAILRLVAFSSRDYCDMKSPPRRSAAPRGARRQPPRRRRAPGSPPCGRCARRGHGERDAGRPRANATIEAACSASTPAPARCRPSDAHPQPCRLHQLPGSKHPGHRDRGPSSDVRAMREPRSGREEQASAICRPRRGQHVAGVDPAPLMSRSAASPRTGASARGRMPAADCRAADAA